MKNNDDNSTKKEVLILIDISNLIFRAYFAMPKLSTSTGEPTGAILGVTRMVHKALREIKPDYIAVAMDSPVKVERKNFYNEYKANRPAPPEDLVKQIPVIEKILQLYGLKTFTAPGWEADDVIASLAKKACEVGMDVRIFSSDKDLLQLVSPKIKIFYEDTKTKQIIEMDEKKVEEKFMVPPSKMLDFLAMVGDSSDNIPGIPKVGEKTAAQLLKEFGSLENILKNADKISKPSLREAIISGKESALLSRKLASLKMDLFEEIDFKNLKPYPPDINGLIEIFRKLEFRELLNSLRSETEIKTENTDIKISGAVFGKEYFTVFDLETLEKEINGIEKAGAVSIDLETTGIDPVSANIVGISLSFKEGRGCYIPVGHRYVGVPSQPPLNIVLEKLKFVLENPKIEKYGHHIKFDDIILMRHGITTQAIAFDTMIASYLLDPEKHQHRLEQVSMSELGYQMITYDEVTRKSRGKQLKFDEVPVDEATRYSAEDAEVVFSLVQKMRPEIKKEGLEKIMLKVELPLSRVLAKMQLCGVAIDIDFLSQLEKEFVVELDRLEKEVWEIAGMRFNLASPKQLQEVLFKNLGIPAKKKTKTGYSTDSEVLESIEHPIAKKILEHRTLSKLLGTYVRALPEQINPATGRIHTSYNQAVAATGRLSSSNPNLQNIPARSEKGLKIRKAFIPGKGCLMLSADYSQIDLRVLAHLSGDPVLVDAFMNGEDIHLRTAMEIFGVKKEDVTPQMRASAKAINFGVIYGQTEFGLAQQTGISKHEAKVFIKKYFERYRGVKEYMDRIIEEAGKGKGITTILGRRRFLRGITSKNKTERMMAERVARNTPIQGSAADIIKLAMVKIDEKFTQKRFSSKMLLNVHDELVFEVPEEEKEEVEREVLEIMENVVKLKIPLVVSAGWGKNWAEAHP